jgi:hypothetical protein
MIGKTSRDGANHRQRAEHRAHEGEVRSGFDAADHDAAGHGRKSRPCENKPPIPTSSISKNRNSSAL